MSLSRIIVAVAVAVSATTALSQPSNAAPLAPQETRAEIAAAALDAETRAVRESDRDKRAALQETAKHLRQRLSEGDLHVGDKVIIEVVNPPDMRELADTFIVRHGQVLQLTGIKTEIPLQGILRSELTDHITSYLKREFDNPQIRTRTTIGLFLTGEVMSRGSISVTQDALLRDVVTAAGTMTPVADIEKIMIRRKGKVLHDAATTRDALTDGRTISDMQLQGGDEIDVGMKRQMNWFNVLQFATSAVGLFLGLYSLAK